MAITPNTDIYLIKCPLEIDNINQLTFTNEVKQAEYFLSLPKLEADGCTYQRKDSTIKYPSNIDDILEYNYVMYRNDSYSNKWFYAFIESMDYVNDNMTHVHIKQDSWQTWQFDIELKDSFIEREHVTNDAIGANTVPEGLEHGDYICNSVENFNYIAGIKDSYILVQVTELLPAMIGLANERIYTGIPQGCYLIGLNTTPSFELYNFIKAYDKEGKSEAIVAMSLIPKRLIPDAVGITFNTSPAIDAIKIPTSFDPINIGNISWSINRSIDGYVPRNNKLFTGEYNYLLMSNNGGEDVKFNWEYMSGNTANFKLDASIGQGIQSKLIPTNYKKTTGSDGYEWSLSGQNLPILSWSSDYYLNWEAVNGKNVEVQTSLQAGGFFSNVVGGMLTGNLGQMVGAPMSLASQVANTMQQVREAEIVPNQAKGSSSTGNINYSSQKAGFTGYRMSIRREYAKIVDDYFSAFGYKVNSIKTPNINSRLNWNFIKTQDVNIKGYMPQDDLQDIKAMFNRGVTFWHNPTTYLDYSQVNSIK